MCGVAGYLNLDGAPAIPALVERMIALIAHRGPDSDGVYVDGPLALGHKRLSIIDLSPLAHQPMTTPDGRYVISYNGEAYNFRELRKELEARGRKFASQSDTEVVLHAYAEWGSEALTRINGMFALAIWDSVCHELFLARDRCGIKPLYYARVGGAFLFGSEIKAFLRHPSFKPSMDKDALVEYLTFQNYFAERTLFKDVRLLPAGTWLRIGTDGNNIERGRYWDYDFREPKDSIDEAEYVEEVDRLMRQALSRQLVSDVEIGSYLSGGMDSGTLTALAARQLPYIKTFTAGFDLSSASGIELGFDERPMAERISYLNKTEHYEIVVKAGDMERCLPSLVWHLEEPRVGQSYPNFYISRLASKFCKVVLAGTGGDEMFGGYPWRYIRESKPLDFESFVDRYYQFWQRLTSNTELRSLLAPIRSETEHVDPREIFRGVFPQAHRGVEGLAGSVNRSLYLEAKTFLNGLLVVEDKLSMAHGLETRVPFLDNDLVDFATRIPVSMKLADPSQVMRIDENEPDVSSIDLDARRNDGKLALRKAMSRYMPQEITSGAKKGFSGPDASWFRGESIDLIRRAFLDRRDAAIYDFLDRDTVHQLINEHLSGRHNRRLLIWSLLMIEYWCRTFLRSDPIGPIAGI